MTKVIVVVNDGMVESVYTRNKNIDLEVIDLDSQDAQEARESEKRLAEIERSKSYRDIAR